jgi:hypothetical protein
MSLALGIEANTAIYSFMDAILMRALPVQNPESLVVFNWHAKERLPVIQSSSDSQWDEPKLGMASGNMPLGFFEELRAGNPVFSSVSGFPAPARSTPITTGFVFFGSETAPPEKFVARRDCGLTGRLQARLTGTPRRE